MSLQKRKIAVRLHAAAVSAALRGAAFLQGLVPPQFRLIQLGTAFWQSRALHTAATLDIASTLADDEYTIDRLALQVSADTENLYRLMRFLAAVGVFEETAPREFRNNGTSRYLRTDEPANVRAMVLMHNSCTMSRPWHEHFHSSVVAGGVPFETCHSKELVHYMDDEPAFDTLFADAMDSVEGLLGTSYATDFDWSQFDRVFDLGGSKGGKMITLLEHHAHLSAVVIDRPAIIESAATHWRSRGKQHLLSRVRFECADILSSMPAASSNRDVYFLSAVLHGMDDASCWRLLTNLADASTRAGARIVLMESVAAEVGASLPSAQVDVQLMMATRGRVRTLGEWRRLIERARLELEEIVLAPPSYSLLVLRGARVP